MTQSLARLEALLGRLHRRAEAHYRGALDLAARNDVALAQAPVLAQASASRLQASESLRLVLVAEAARHDQRVAASRQALQEAALEHKKVERLLERRREEVEQKQARRQKRTVEGWLRSRRQ